MPGPLPDPDAVRRNTPTVPTTVLPLSGRKGETPDLPSWMSLSPAGEAWWAWAWATPQAVAWGTSVGMEVTVARRASLEDDLAVADDPRVRLQVLKLIDALDDRLGLSPKAMAFLRWKIVDDTPAEQVEPAEGAGNVTGINARRARLTDAS